MQLQSSSLITAIALFLIVSDGLRAQTAPDTSDLEVRVATRQGRVIESEILSRNVRLDTTTVVIRPGQTIRSVLLEHSVQPHPTAIAWVATLNPHIASFSRLRAGTQLRVLTATGLPQNFTVAIAPSTAVSATFTARANATAIELASWQLSFPNGEVKSRVLGAAGQITTLLQGLSTKLNEMPPELVAELTERISRFRSAMADQIASGTRANQEFLERVERFESDLENYEKCIQDKWGGCTVNFSVETIEAGTVKKYLQVWYQGEFVNEPKRLGVSSPATGPVVEGDYYFWATNTSGQVLSMLTPKKVRRCSVPTDCTMTLLLK
jgi:hypothetical protein